MNKLHTFAFTLLILAVNSSVFAQAVEAPTSQESTWDLKQNFEKWKTSSEDLSKKVTSWVKEDVHKAGAWEYKILETNFDDFATLEKQLNELGAKRWECFWIDRKDNKLILFLKKSKFSYIRSIPAKELIHLVPDANNP